jgi:hypothetical protein
MAQAQGTTAMQAAAEMLASYSDRWAHGTRNADGQPFVLFAGSKGAVYYTSERGCSCPGYRFRGICSHRLALELQDEREARENGLASESEIDCHLAGLRADHDATAAALRRRRYESLFPADEFETATAHTVGGG